MRQVGFGRSSEVLRLHVIMESKHFEIRLQTVRKLGRSEETGDQTNKKEGESGSYSESLYGGWGQGLRPIQPSPETQGPITLFQP